MASRLPRLITTLLLVLSVLVNGVLVNGVLASGAYAGVAAASIAPAQAMTLQNADHYCQESMLDKREPSGMMASHGDDYDCCAVDCAYCLAVPFLLSAEPLTMVVSNPVSGGRLSQGTASSFLESLYRPPTNS